MNTKTRVARLKWLIPLWAAASSLALMLGIGLAYPNSSAATAAATGSSPQQEPALTLDPTCELAWRMVSSPNEGSGHNFLQGVAAVSANDVWAVGRHAENGTLTMHWDGASWTVSPSGTGLLGGLSAVAAVSANDVWAVGYYGLTLHWDGSSWSTVPNPTNDVLQGVAAISTNDVWAVGEYGSIMHWDGSSWSFVPNPSTGFLKGVAAISANDVWAAGYSYFLDPEYGGEYYDPLTMHWDGASWSVVPSPIPYPVANALNVLDGVTAVSANDVWAVGTYYDGTTTKTLTMHWDGANWSVVPNPLYEDAYGVAAVSTNDVWAVGEYGSTMHWDGSSWSTVRSRSNELLTGVAAISANDVWAVGYTDPGDYGIHRTLTLHYSEDCPVGTPTPTSTATSAPTYTPTPVPDFTLSVSPTSRSVGRPGTTTYTVNLASVNSYSGSVSLSVSGLPDRVDYSFSTNPVTLTPGGSGSSILTITTRKSTPWGTYTLTIRGTDGVRTRSQNVTLIVSR